LVLAVAVHPADLADRTGGRLVLAQLPAQFPHLARIWADQAYAGAFARWVRATLGITLEVVYPWWRQLKRYQPEMYAQLGPGFKVIPRRWVVERTFAWLTFQRRLNRDYERLPQTSESFIYLAMTRLMLRRLAR
jgi:putative transposase